MSFQSFSDTAKIIDQQEIETNSFVINFRKDGGNSFSVDPNHIFLFLSFMSNNHEKCKQEIEKDEKFDSTKNYLNYQEKPYRALYKLFAKEQGFNTVGSLGGSQTKELTKVISKLISYTAEIPYSSVENNTYFDKNTINLAIEKAPKNSSSLGKPTSYNNKKDRFILWLKNLGLSDKTIKSYASASIALADKILLKDELLTSSLYDTENKALIRYAINRLHSDSEWQTKNDKGNAMYQAGIKKFIEFLDTEINLTSLPKPFILLAGISGTGKTRYVRKQALAHGAGNKNFCQIPVRPDWHEPSDLLGYISRISGTKYITTKALQFIIEAWRVVAPNADASGLGELDLSVPPYWLCLDEMNLAPVEQYFADYLSVLETREFNDGEYSCEPLLDKTVLATDGADIRSDLGLKDDDGLWAYFLNNGIPLPPNLIVAGTVNMDETTHGFSRKVIDRALTIDFGEFFPNDYSKFFAAQNVEKLFTYSQLTQAEQKDLQTSIDPDGSKSLNFLDSVNGVLKQTPFELAYRALNELLLHVACFNPQDEHELQAVWDDFLMSKVLPRIDGDDDKLRIINNSEPANLIDALVEVLKPEFDEIWDTSKKRTDLFRTAHDGSKINDISCRSRKKLEWMKNRLQANTFTSFWP